MREAPVTPHNSDRSGAELEALLARAAEQGAKRALADFGLDDDEAALDIRDLRSLVDCIRLVRRTAMQTAVRMITTGVMLALLAGIVRKHPPRAVCLLGSEIVYRVSLWTHTKTLPAFKFCRSLIPVAVAVGRMMRRSGSLRKAIVMA